MGQHTAAEDRRYAVDTTERAGLAAYFHQDRVSWGAIWGGLLTALGLFILLSLLASAIGITTVRTGGADAETVNRFTGVAGAIIGLVSFFVGGYVAGAMGGWAARPAGMLNGFLVWALANVIVLALAAFGLGQLFGAAGGLYDVYRSMGLATSVEVDQQQLMANLQTTAWIAFISMGLAALAATLGGLLGSAARPVPADADVD